MNLVRETLVLLELKSTWKLHFALSSKSNENAWERVLKTADCIEKLLVDTVGREKRRKAHSGILGRKTTKTLQMNSNESYD